MTRPVATHVNPRAAITTAVQALHRPVIRPRAGARGGGSSGSPRCVRIFRIGAGSVMKAMRRMSPPHAGQSSGKSSPMRARSCAEAMREVSWEVVERGADAVEEGAAPSLCCAESGSR